MRVKTEIWAGHEIRFVEKESGEWWAVLLDIANALELRATKIKERLPDDVLSKDYVTDSLGRKQEMLIVNEYGIYETVFESRKKEAKKFKRWVFEMLKELRQASGLEAFQVFRMLDKDHQKEAMKKLNAALSQSKPINYIKANTIANKAVSTRHGHQKMVKKNEMPPEMLVDRQPILDDTVNLIGINNEFGLELSVSNIIYKKYTGDQHAAGSS